MVLKDGACCYIIRIDTLRRSFHFFALLSLGFRLLGLIGLTSHDCNIFETCLAFGARLAVGAWLAFNTTTVEPYYKSTIRSKMLFLIGQVFFKAVIRLAQKKTRTGSRLLSVK